MHMMRLLINKIVRGAHKEEGLKIRISSVVNQCSFCSQADLSMCMKSNAR